MKRLRLIVSAVLPYFAKSTVLAQQRLQVCCSSWHAFAEHWLVVVVEPTS
jgi:hypothetical protein